MLRLRRCLLGLVILFCSVRTARAGWLVYVGGGVQKTQGEWQVHDSQVVFHANGTLLSVRLEDVDVPASQFLSWQLLEDRRRTQAPAGGAMGAVRQPAPKEPTLRETGARRPAAKSGWAGLPGFVGKDVACVSARVERVVSAETLEVSAGGKTETVHAACLGAPQVQQRYPELAWFGRASTTGVASLVRAGQTVCLAEEQPPLRDPLGHRRLYIELAGGRDLTAEVIGRGLGVLRSGVCSRAERYRPIAKEAFLAERGHWGPTSFDAALAVLSNGPILAAGPPIASMPGAG
ncbi:MAG: hypothetical protein ABI609_08875 [Acidobacteriota bacterium]